MTRIITGLALLALLAGCGGSGGGGSSSRDRAPVAALAVDPAQGPAPLLVRLDATASTDDGAIVDASWDFGDGNTGSGLDVQHTFTEAGRFTVTLTITDDDGLANAAFYGTDRAYALGDTAEQRFMGRWSDGTAVREPLVTDSP